MLSTVATDEFDHSIKLEPINYYDSSIPQMENRIDNNVIKQEPMPIKVHSKSKPQACKICGKILSSASSYYVHMKLHSNNKPFQCTVCEAAFCRKPYLEVHMRTHTGERPFQCDTCLKRFSQKSSLNTHKRVHTGERPYACNLCEKRFAVKSYVTAHRWSHLVDKPLTCANCNLVFSSKNQYILHIRTHAEKNYVCGICQRTFVRDSYLIRHQHRVHQNNHDNGMHFMQNLVNKSYMKNN